MKRFLLAIAAIAALACGSALAHKPSDSYLTLVRDGTALRGQWDIALRDLETAIGVDADGDGAITWGEVRAKRSAIEAYALSRLTVRSAGKPCLLRATAQAIDTHTDGAYAVMTLEGECEEAAPTLAIDYRLLFDVDPTHRGLLNFGERGETRSAIFSADKPSQTVGGDTGGWLVQLVQYAHEGVWHIWTGFDHMLFLLSLLLPAVLIRRERAWQPTGSFRAAFADVVKVVTAFTIAHSITLSLAVLGVVSLPSRIVESAIALSVVSAALNNVWPLVANARWLAAFGFGLLHGFGFAGALADLGLPTNALALSLAGFNIGVELGQLAIVAAFLPIAFASRATWAYRRVALAGGSLAIAALACAWFVERAFDLPVLERLASMT
jgi:hypothetical protein